MSDFTQLNRYQRALEAAEQRGASGVYGAVSSQLTFDSAIELDYVEQRRRESLPLLRFGLLLAAVFYVGFLLLDRLLWNRYQVSWLMVPTLGFATGSALILLGLTWIERARPMLDWLSALVLLINAFSFAYISAYSYRVGHVFPHEAPAIQLVYTAFLLNLRFRFAAPVAVITVLVFWLLHAVAQTPADELYERTFMMVAACVIGVLACYLTERAQRLAWLRARLLQELSEHDSLTGLYNHRIFYQRGAQLLKQGHRERCGLAVLVCDVDHFKAFNDSHGHLAGDEALRHIATALSKCARRPLDVAARLGGEEFGLLLYHVTPEAARHRAEEVRNMVRGLKLSGGHRVTISIGVAHLDDCKADNIESLVGRADSALYRAKSQGRDHVAD